MRKKQRTHEPRTEAPAAQEFYEVEQILDKRLTASGILYLIKWRGYPEEKDYTWEPIQHLTEVEDLVREFNATREEQRNRQIKAEQPKPTRIRRHHEDDDEDEEEKEQPKKRARKRKLPSEDKSDRKQTSGNEEDEEEEEIRPRKVEVRAEAKKGREPQGKKAEKQELDRYWEKDGCDLGRICKHFLDGGKLVFIVNVNKGELVCGTIPLRIDEMQTIDEEKLLAYMESWARNHLIEQAFTATQDYKDFESYWRSVD